MKLLFYRVCCIETKDLQLFKAKCKKECVKKKKKKIKNEDYGHYLEDTHLENKINQSEGDKIDVNSPSELLKGFIKTIN